MVSNIPKAPDQSVVTVDYSKISAADKAQMQATVNQAMASMNFHLNKSYVAAAQQQAQMGMLGQGQGAFAQQARATKQPQDKVLRLVTSRENKKRAVTYCVALCAYMVMFSMLAGLTMAGDFSWWKIPIVFLPPATGAVFMCAKVKSFFEEAEAKADLLNWPE
jgi:hypothetical protein